MLRSRNLTAVLSQAVQQDRQGSSIISSILITTNGRPVASFHNTRDPPKPHTASEDEQGDVASTKSVTSSSSMASPYDVDRPMRTKVYGLFASALWDEYARAQDNGKECKWISCTIDDGSLVIHPVYLKSSDQMLLLILVGDPCTALGLMERKAVQTVAVLEEGLKDYKVFD
ncbi:hypothetical protein TRVA0_009S01750 [Trichomonascus vanleenenianus]|uniref:uncharacterized protein n=1 Tax=Trichomonascus vanleenenianus TaxID=2268995 RepID=UPI003EC9E263